MNSTTTYYVYDADEVIAEYDSSNNLLAEYVYGDSIDEVLLMERSSTSYYYHQDGLGSVTDITLASGSVSESYTYDPYGNITSSLSLVGNPYYFTGRRYDDEVEIYYYRARYYDPTIGRFLQRDPLGYWDSLNLYSYVVNSPTNWIDPWGEQMMELPNMIPPGALGGGGDSGLFCSGITSNLSPEDINNQLQFPDMYADGEGGCPPGTEDVCKAGEEDDSYYRVEKPEKEKKEKNWQEYKGRNVPKEAKARSEIIAGKGSKRKIDKIDELVRLFGGKRGGWSKRVDRNTGLHWYEYNGRTVGGKYQWESDPF